MGPVLRKPHLRRPQLRGEPDALRHLLRLTLLVVLVAALTLAAGAGAAQGPVGPHQPGAASCSGTTLRMTPPQIFANNSTSAEDWQYVAWRPNVWYWDGSQWTLVARGQWLWSWAYDDSPETYWYDFNNSYIGTTTGAQGPQASEVFNVSALGYYYYVSNEFYWYSNSSSGTASDHLWVTSYSGDDVYGGFCYF